MGCMLQYRSCERSCTAKAAVLTLMERKYVETCHFVSCVFRAHVRTQGASCT